MLERVNFPKVITVLAIVFGIALGSCGITAMIALGGAGRSQGFGPALAVLGYGELLVMILSAVGLVVVAAVWIVASITGSFHRGRSEPQRLFESEEEKKNDEPR